MCMGMGTVPIAISHTLIIGVISTLAGTLIALSIAHVIIGYS